MNTFKIKQSENDLYIFCITFQLNEHITIKIPVEYKIITAVIVCDQMMFYYCSNVNIKYKTTEFILINNDNDIKLIKQCSLGIVASVEMLADSKIYSLHEINKNLNFCL